MPWGLAAGSQRQTPLMAEHSPPVSVHHTWSPSSHCTEPGNSGASLYQEPSGTPTSPEKEALEVRRQEGDPAPRASGQPALRGPPSNGEHGRHDMSPKSKSSVCSVQFSLHSWQGKEVKTQAYFHGKHEVSGEPYAPQHTTAAVPA